MKIDCLYELFVTHLGCSIFTTFKAILSRETYDNNSMQLDCGQLKSLLFTCLKCRGLTRASNIFNDFELSPSFFTGLNSNFPINKVVVYPKLPKTEFLL